MSTPKLQAFATLLQTSEIYDIQGEHLAFIMDCAERAKLNQPQRVTIPLKKASVKPQPPVQAQVEPQPQREVQAQAEPQTKHLGGWQLYMREHIGELKNAGAVSRSWHALSEAERQAVMDRAKAMPKIEVKVKIGPAKKRGVKPISESPFLHSWHSYYRQECQKLKGTDLGGRTAMSIVSESWRLKSAEEKAKYKIPNPLFAGVVATAPAA